MGSKQWFTVFAVYDENEQPYIQFVEAKDKQEARSKALRKADGVILIAGIAPGKVQDADADGLDNIVPIRGKEHAIEVTHVRITKRKIVVPGHCPKCKTHLRRTGSLIETLFDKRKWPAHLSSDNKTVSSDRDGSCSIEAQSIEMVELLCAKCGHALWEGMHGE